MLTIAHRGAWKGINQNSLEAFWRAIQMGCDAIELDVHLTSDGVPVCNHDPIPKATYKELGLPSLREALCLPWPGGRWMVEIKSGPDNEALVEAAVLSIPSEVDALLGSIDPHVCTLLRSRWPAERRIGIVEKLDDLDLHLDSMPRYLALEKSLATQTRVEELCQHEVWCWTVNTLDERDRLLDNGVKGIITDEPDWLMLSNPTP